MSQKEKQSELQVVQLVSSLIAGVLLAFGVSVVVLFITAHLAAGGKLGAGAVDNAEVVASGLGCFCGSCYLALSYRKRILPLRPLRDCGFTEADFKIFPQSVDGTHSLSAAVAGGGAAGFLCAGVLPKRK